MNSNTSLFCCKILRDACDLHHKITEAIDSVTPDMLRNTWSQIEYRLDILREMNQSAYINKNVIFSDK